MYSLTQIFPSPHSNDSKSFVGGWELYLTNTQRAQLLRPLTVPCGRLLALLLYRWTVYNKAPPLLLAFSLSEQNATSKYSSLSTIKFCKAKTIFRLWSDTYSLNIFMYRYMGRTNKKKKQQNLLYCVMCQGNILHFWTDLMKRNKEKFMKNLI